MSKYEIRPIMLANVAEVFCPTCKKLLMSGQVMILVENETEKGVFSKKYGCCRTSTQPWVFGSLESADAELKRIKKLQKRGKLTELEYLPITAEFIVKS